MARAWIEDLWLTDATVTMPDGGTVRKPPTAAMKRSLAAHPNDPMKARVPQEHRTARYGQGKRWRVNWRAAGPDGIVKKKTRAFADYKDAESFVAAMEDDIRAGRYVNPDDSNRSFAQVAQEWLNSKNNLRDSSYVGYEKSLRWYVLPKWGDRPIGGITEAEINEWVKQLAMGTAPHDFKRKTEMQPLKAKTLKAVVKDAFGGVMGYAAASKRRWIAANPMDGVALPQSKTADDRVFLTNAQVESLAEAAGRVDRWNPKVSRAIVLFLAYTGLRANEAFALRVGDVDFDAMRIKVNKSITINRSEHVMEGKTKTGRSRLVPIPSFLVDDLKEIAGGRDDGEYFFTAYHGGMIHLNTWRTRVWYPAKTAAGLDGIEGLCVHSLRHTYASLAIAAGCDVKTLQTAMGHASATETLNTYTALWPDRLDDVTHAIEANYAAWRMGQKREEQ